VKTSVTVVASNMDESINVHFDTDVTHKKVPGWGEVQHKAVTKLKTMLKKHNPTILPELVSFRVIS
jgi:hypothetical protein